MTRLSELARLADELAILASVQGHQVSRTRWSAVRQRLEGNNEAAGVKPDDHELDEAVAELQRSGWVRREQAIAELPVDLRWLFEAGALTLAQLGELACALDVATLADLRRAVQSQLIRQTPTLGGAVHDAIASALPALRAAFPSIPIGRALAVAEPLLERLREVEGVLWALPAGSLRRGADLVGDIALVVRTTRPPLVLDAMADAEGVEHVSFRTRDRIVVAVGSTQVVCHCPDDSESVSTLVCATGSQEHLTALETIAHQRRLTLAPAGLIGIDGHRRGVESEVALYAALGLPWIPPELRAGADEIDRARAGTLPDLIEPEDILGDLHMHTTWSDGRDSIEAMASAATALGYRFIAITDHSPSSASAKNLALEDVSKQAEEIARVRELFPQLTILHGCEVDILPDGRLDFPDKTLRRFDIVLASLHDRAGHSPQQLLRRYLAAMLHPLVTILTHPTNRRFPRLEGYEMDYDRLFEAAVETKTALEVDGAPSHVDLDATRCARAAGMGVTLAINGDSHAAGQLKRHMDIALLTARRGAVERRHVLNSRPLPEIRALIASKRSRFPV